MCCPWLFPSFPGLGALFRLCRKTKNPGLLIFWYQQTGTLFFVYNFSVLGRPFWLEKGRPLLLWAPKYLNSEFKSIRFKKFPFGIFFWTSEILKIKKPQHLGTVDLQPTISKLLRLFGGPDRIRTDDPYNANVVRSQLRYRPILKSGLHYLYNW